MRQVLWVMAAQEAPEIWRVRVERGALRRAPLITALLVVLPTEAVLSAITLARFIHRMRKDPSQSMVQLEAPAVLVLLEVVTVAPVAHRVRVAGVAREQQLRQEELAEPPTAEVLLAITSPPESFNIHGLLGM